MGGSVSSNRAFHGVLCLVAASFLMTAASCETSGGVYVEIPDFHDAEVLGLTIWKKSGSNQFEAECDIELSDPEWLDGQYVVEYDQSCADGTNSRLLAEVKNNGSGGIRFRLQILSSSVAGTYRASAYNAVGDSGLSNAIDI